VPWLTEERDAVTHGTIHDRNGIDVLIDAPPFIPDDVPDVHLPVCGEHEYGAPCESCAVSWPGAAP
jgi:hypothetical protein